MKNARNTQGFKWLTLALVFTFSAFLAQAQVEFDDTISTEADVNPNGTLQFTNRSFDTEIKTWDKNYVELQMHVRLKAHDQEDINATLEAIREISFDGSPASLRINTLFWDNMISNLNYKIKLKTGERVTLKKFSVENTLYIPKTLSIDIDNKYADINMESISGSADIKIYNGKLYAGSVGGKTLLDLRYSKVYMDRIPEAVMDLYDSDIELKICGNFSIKSKYSKVEIDQAGDMVYDSYDDNFNIGAVGNFDGKAKYTDFVLGPAGLLYFDFYDCNLKCPEAGNIKGSSKYSEVSVGTAQVVELTSSYDDSFVFESISAFNCPGSKYTDYEIGNLTDSFVLQSYDDAVSIHKLDAGFSRVSLDGKYGDFRFNVQPPAAYKLMVDMKYGKVDYPGNDFDRKTYIKDNSNLTIEATTKNTQPGTASLLQVKGYDHKVVINDLAE